MYCELCGKKCISEWTGRYCKSTGLREMREVCPDACAHGNHDDEEIKPISKKKFFGLIEAGPYWAQRCKRCGCVKEYYYCD